MRGSTLPLAIAGGWIGIEFVLRRGLVSVVATDVETVFTVDWTVLLVGFPLLAALLGWIASKRGRPPDEWGYDWSLRAALAGVVGIAVIVAVTAITGRIDSALFSLDQIEGAFGDAVANAVRATPVLAVIFLVGNGVIGPIAEEIVWRGIVQSEFVETLGPAIGIALAAVLFALKHVVVDLTIVRLTTLLAIGLVLGALRHRYGTVSSTITHIGMNTLSTAPVVALAFA